MTLDERIKEAWDKYPEAVVSVESVATGKKTPRIKSVPKNELRVIVRHGKRPTVYVHKGALCLTAQFRSTVDFDGLTDDDLRKIGVLPYKSQHCSTCGCFTTCMYVGANGLVCSDCLKGEKAQRSV